MTPVQEHSNNLFPVFLKLHQLRILIVGGGYIGMEKLQAVLLNSPEARIKLVATVVSEEIKERVADNKLITIIERPFASRDFDDVDLAIVAIDDPVVSELIANTAKEKGVLINVADKPALCDFYLGSVVKKGNLKIAISTNGKSPTMAKRLKELLQDTLPDELDALLDNMQSIRNQLSGSFADKVKQLNQITKMLTSKEDL